MRRLSMLNVRTWAVSLGLFAFGFLVLMNMDSGGGISVNESQIIHRWYSTDSRELALVENKVYEVVDNNQFRYLVDYYDADYFSKNYVVEQGVVYRTFDFDGPAWLRTDNSLSDGFETYSSINDLIFTADDLMGQEVMVGKVKVYDPGDLGTTWTALTLQSSSYPTVKDYVELRHQILEGPTDFEENKVEVSQTRSVSGDTSLRFESIDPGNNLPTAKASIATENVFFEAGDDFWFKGMFYIEEGMPQTILDLESTWLLESSGIRVAFSENGAPYVELKAFEKPVWRNRDFRMPTNRWVEVKVHFGLDTKDGTIEMWIDDEKVIDGKGQTIPLANVPLDSVEIGITATNQATVLYIDGVIISESGL